MRMQILFIFLSRFLHGISEWAPILIYEDHPFCMGILSHLHSQYQNNFLKNCDPKQVVRIWPMCFQKQNQLREKKKEKRENQLNILILQAFEPSLYLLVTETLN